MGVSLERVQNKFACIIGELCNEPLVLSQFAVWVDLRIAEYKTNGTISLDCSGTSPNPPWMKGVKNRPQRLGSNSMDTGQRNPHRHDGYSPNPTSSPISNQYYNDRTQPSESSRYEHTSTSQSPVSSRLSPDIVAVKQEPNTNQSTCALRRKRHSDAGDAMHSDYFSPMKSRRLNEDTSSLSEPIQESPSNQSLMSIINTENDSVSLEPIGDSFPGDSDMEQLRPELDLTSENNSFDTQLPSTSSDQSAWPSQFNQSAPSTSSQPDTPNLRGNYKCYTVPEKKHALELVSQNGLKPTGRLLNIPPSTLRAWRKKFGDQEPFACRNPGQSAHHPEAEEELFTWILRQRDLHLPVSREAIAQQARTLVNQSDFLASSGWVDRFLGRHNLSLRCRTGMVLHLPKDLHERSRIFLRQVKESCLMKQFDDDCIINMDEILLHFDMIPSRKITEKGEGDVVIRSAGAQKRNVTVVLAISASGAVLEPLVIFKGKFFPKDISSVPNGIHVEMDPNGCMTEKVMEIWLTKVVRPHTQDRPCLMIIDSFAGHATEKVEKDMEKINVTPAFIPAGCTSKIQPLDISISRPFKAHIRTLLTAYMKQLVESSSSVHPASRQVILEWVKQAWDMIAQRKEVVQKSFRVTGLLGAIRNTQDETLEAKTSLFDALDREEWLSSLDGFPAEDFKLEAEGCESDSFLESDVDCKAQDMTRQKFLNSVD